MTDRVRTAVVSSRTEEQTRLCQELESNGYSAMGLRPGFHMLSYVASVHPRVVLYDAWEPWEEAVSVIGQIKLASPHCSLIVIREHATWDHFLEGVAAGADDLLSRPFSSVQIRGSVGLALKLT